jgi:sugar phosphate isomerase/epimerase
VIALSTGSLYTYGIGRVFALAAQAGFDGIEVLIDDRWDTRQASYLQRLSDEHHLSICSLHNPFVPYIPGWPNDLVERLKATVALAQELGVETVVVHLPTRVGYVMVRSFKRQFVLPTPPSPFAKMRRWMAQELTTFGAYNGVRLCVENMPAKQILGRRFNPCWWNNVDEWSSRFSHLTLDTTHLGTWGLDPLEVYHQVKERVSHLHLANFNGQEHRRLQDGHLPLADLLHAMRDDGYTGAVVVELEPDALAAEDEGQVLAHLRAQVAFCRQHFEE